MPQKLSDWWQVHLGSDYQADHELYLNTIGNLSLTAYNSELSNFPFPKKKEYLSASHLELNRYFQNMSSWRKEEIEARSNLLADLALQLWPYFGEAYPIAANANDVTGMVPKTVTILGQKFDVDSWRDVQTCTLSTLAELEPDLFCKLVEEYPRFISPDADRFRRKRQLNNGFFIEVNLSAKDIYRFCNQAIESVGLTAEDWLVESELA